MPEVLSEYFGDHNKRAQVKMISSELGKTTMFEVLCECKSVGVYRTEQEAENIAKNYALGSAVSRT